MLRKIRPIWIVSMALVIGCATVGTGDPVLVKAEDVLSSSLSVYDAAMRYHFANSTKEKPAVYQTFERVRTGFPTAWKALYDGTREYKTTRDTGKLNALTGAVQKMLDDVTPLIGG